MKKLFLIAMAMLMCLLSVSALAQEAEIPQAVEELIASVNVTETERQELRHAAQLGMPMENLGKATVTGQEMTRLLDWFVDYAAPDQLPAWKKLYNQMGQLRRSTIPLQRVEAMAALFKAANLVGGQYVQYNQALLEEAYGFEINWDAVFMNMRLFGNENRQYYFMTIKAGGLDSAGYHFNIGHVSAFSGQHPFALDYETNSFKMNRGPNYAEAVLAVVRLIASANPELFERPDPRKPDSSILTPELIAKANTNPVITAEHHPLWSGFVLGWDNGYTYESAFSKNIHHLADWGFNSARVLIHYENLFDPEDVTVGKTSELSRLDSLVAAAIERDMHLNILIGSLPGRTFRYNYTARSFTGEADLFKNKEKQEESFVIFSTLAERYKDVPSYNLSFTPFMEPEGNMGIPGPAHTMTDVGKYLSKVIDVIREHNEDRLIIYEATCDTHWLWIPDKAKPVRKEIAGKGNVMINYNYAENPFIYAIMNVEGVDIDNSNHSMYMTPYPIRYYSTRPTVDSKRPLTLDGFLPAGTVIDLYLAKSNGSRITIKADGEAVYTEKLGYKTYDVGLQISRYYPYAKSDKKISVTLEKDTKKLSIMGSDKGFKWSGMDVILPEQYAVDRWFHVTNFSGKEHIRKERTSRIIISPTEGNGSRITIHDDATYTTDKVLHEATPETVKIWGEKIEDYDGNCVIRFEEGAFSGVVWKDLKAYYEDILSMFNRHGFSWWSNDFWIMTDEYPQTRVIAEMPTTSYAGFDHFCLELLELLQKHQYKDQYNQ